MTDGTPWNNPERPLAIEARALSGPAGGVVRYIRGLLRGLLKVQPDLPLVLLCDRASGLAGLQGIRGVVVPPAGEFFRLFWDWQSLPSAVRRLNPLLLHCTKPSGTPFKRGLPPIVTTIYDVIPLEFPSTQTVAQRLYWKMQLPAAAAAASALLTISEFSKRGIVERLGVSPERVFVTYPGLDPEFAPPSPEAVQAMRRRYGLDRPYILNLGTIEPRKNVDVLLRAFGRVTGKLSHLLVIAGRWGWKTKPVREAAKAPRLRDRVRFLGPVREADLPALYGGAEAFVFLSRSEGFGFPPLEAMACGVPSLVSSQGSLEEVVGSAALLVSPDDEERVAASLLRVTEDEGLRIRLRQDGPERAKKFTWEATAKGTLDVYRRVLGHWER